MRIIGTPAGPSAAAPGVGKIRGPLRSYPYLHFSRMPSYTLERERYEEGTNVMISDIHLVLAWFGFLSLMLLLRVPFLFTTRRKWPL